MHRTAHDLHAPCHLQCPLLRRFARIQPICIHPETPISTFHVMPWMKSVVGVRQGMGIHFLPPFVHVMSSTVSSSASVALCLFPFPFPSPSVLHSCERAWWMFITCSSKMAVWFTLSERSLGWAGALAALISWAVCSMMEAALPSPRRLWYDRLPAAFTEHS